jgi:hypothetical protein
MTAPLYVLWVYGFNGHPYASLLHDRNAVHLNDFESRHKVGPPMRVKDEDIDLPLVSLAALYTCPPTPAEPTEPLFKALSPMLDGLHFPDASRPRRIAEPPKPPPLAIGPPAG